MSHPYGIQPRGQLLINGGHDIRDEGLGSLSVLSDQDILEVLGHLDYKDLGLLAVVSKGLYCFSNFEELWKAFALGELGEKLCWHGTWKASYLASSGISAPLAGHCSKTSQTAEQEPMKKKRKMRVSGRKGSHNKADCGEHGKIVPQYALCVRGFYSDLLYLPWFCATRDISTEWLEVDNIERCGGHVHGDSGK